MTRINSHNKINKNYNTKNNYQKSIQSKTPYKRPIIDLDHLFKRIYTSTKELLCTQIKKKQRRIVKQNNLYKITK